MLTKAALILAEMEIERFPELRGWQVEIVTKPKRRLGRCQHKTKTILLTESFVLRNDHNLVRSATRHEIAHALVGPGHAHGPVWQAKAIELGVPPTPCTEAAEMPPGKYIAVCPNCAKVYHFYRKPLEHREYWCKKCGRFRGGLTFVPNEEEAFHEE